MPKPYSVDLRARVIEDVETGASRREAAERCRTLWNQPQRRGDLGERGGIRSCRGKIAAARGARVSWLDGAL
jgi:hypothetical protein